MTHDAEGSDYRAFFAVCLAQGEAAARESRLQESAATSTSLAGDQRDVSPDDPRDARVLPVRIVGTSACRSRSARRDTDEHDVRQKKAAARARKGKTIRQVAALPFRITPDGEVEILVVTSRKTKRFVVPKGWTMKRLPAPRAARIEAEEEAGGVGDVSTSPLGTYQYWKRLRSVFVPIEVQVYPLKVKGELDS